MITIPEIKRKFMMEVMIPFPKGDDSNKPRVTWSLFVRISKVTKIMGYTVDTKGGMGN